MGSGEIKKKLWEGKHKTELEGQAKDEQALLVPLSLKVNLDTTEKLKASKDNIESRRNF